MTNADGKEEAAAAESDARRKISGIDGCIVIVMSFFLSPSNHFSFSVSGKVRSSFKV